MKRLTSAGSPLSEKSICVITFYVSLSFVFSDFSISAVYGALGYMVFSAACAILFFAGKEWKQKHWSMVDFLLLVFILTVSVNVLRSGSFHRSVIYYLIILVSSVVLFWTTDTIKEKYIKIAKLCVVSVAVFFSVVNIIYMFFPDVVTKAAFSVISQTSIDEIVRLSWEGYGYAFGEDVGYTAVIIIMAIGILYFGPFQKNCVIRIPLLLILTFGLIAIQRRGELMVCLIALAIMMVADVIWSVKDTGELKTVLKNTVVPYAIQTGAILLAFVIFFEVTETSRFAEEVKEMTAISVQTETTVDEPVGSPQNEMVDGSIATESVAADEETEQTYVVVEESKDSDVNSIEVILDRIGNGRLILWKLAWEGFLEKPFFGHGWGSFAEIAPRSGNTLVTNAHCVYLQLLCETGIVGFVLVGTVFIMILIASLKKSKKSGNHNHQLGLFILLYILGYGAIDNSLYYPHCMMFLIFALMLEFKSENPGKSKENHRVSVVVK